VGGAVSLLSTGCDDGLTVEARAPAPRAGRSVFGEPRSRDTAESRASDRKPDVAAAPVEATKPDVSPSDVALASAKIVADEPPTEIASADSPPRVLDPPVDASKYPGGIIPASANAQPLPGGPRLLVPHKTFRAEGKPPALRVSYDDLDLLKVLNVDPVPPDVVDQFPDWLRRLDGQRVRIRGFMFPSYEEMLSAFVLTRDTGVCCFGPNPKVYYLIGVKLKEGTKVRYVQNRPVDVVGTFHIQPVVSDGNWFQLYKISDASVVE
jgi:hypothetical protein